MRDKQCVRVARRGWKEGVEQDNKLGALDIFLFEVSAITKCMFVLEIHI